MKKGLVILLGVAAMLVIVGAVVVSFIGKKEVTISDVPLNDLKKLKAKHFAEFEEKYLKNEESNPELGDKSQGT